MSVIITVEVTGIDFLTLDLPGDFTALNLMNGSSLNTSIFLIMQDQMDKNTLFYLTCFYAICPLICSTGWLEKSRPDGNMLRKNIRPNMLIKHCLNEMQRVR